MRLTFSRAMAILYALPIFAHAHVFLGYFLANPLYRFGGIGSTVPGILPGQPTIDPNVGGIDQALTMRAVDTIFSGGLPWWNPFEGFGAPLAGEMQCSALFPFAWLVAAHDGPLLIDVLLSILAGFGMMLLLRRLGLGIVSAFAGSVALEMCGTFSWLSGAWSYSIAWLPYLVLGIELCRSSEPRTSRIGVALVAVSSALLAYSGFIETAFLEALAAAVWAIARLVVVRSPAFAVRLAIGAALGAALGSPILVAFADTLAMSIVGMHAAGAAGATMAPQTLAQKILPYIYGPIFASHQAGVTDVWGGTGGYIGFGIPALAFAGLWGRRYKTVRIVCAIVAAFGFAGIFGGPLLSLLLFLPVIKNIVVYRYIDPTIAFAVAVLAAIAIDDVWSSGRRFRTRILAGYGAMLALTVWSLVLARAQVFSAEAASTDATLAIWHWFTVGAFVATSAGIICVSFVRDAKSAATIAGLVVCVEATVFLFLPTLSYPRGATITLGGVRYLQSHLGNRRFFSLGPIGPNYGSYFGIADIDYADLPAPANSYTYVSQHLDPDADAINFYAGMTRPNVSRAKVLADNLGAFANVSVKYVLLDPHTPPPTPRLIPRFHDAVMAIWEIPGSAEYFRAPGCRIRSESRTSLVTDCTHASTLCRRELSAPGWSASVDGKRESLQTCDEIFQSIPLPAKTSTITWSFSPPYMPFAEASFVVGSIATIFMIVWGLTATGRPRTRPHVIS